MPDSRKEAGSQLRTTTSLQANKETLADWDAFVEDSSIYRSRAELIRHAVNQHISTQHQNQEREQESLAELKDTMRQLRNQIEDLQTTVDAIESRTRETPERIVELASDLFKHIPNRDDLMNYQQAATKVGDGIGSAHVGPDSTDSGRISAFAEELDASEDDVEEALSQLQQETHRVYSMEINGETRYYKEV